MPAFKAIETRIGTELAQFSRYLWAQRVAHRIFDAPDGTQVLVVAREQDVAPVREAFARWRAGELSLEDAAPAPRPAPGRIARAWRAQPVTLAGILLSVLGAAIVMFDTRLEWLRWLAFTDFRPLPGGRLDFESVAATYARGEYWRLLTPVFLHFGVLHLAFNSLWLWELGRRIERARGHLTLLALLVLTGAGGNIAQYLFDGGVMFGGMSGVIYGLLGYAWVWNRVSGAPGLVLPPGLMAVMLGWLLLCMSGLVEAIGFGAIANAAHGAGLALGALLGLGAALLYSRPPDPQP
jgi:GlpG protein